MEAMTTNCAIVEEPAFPDLVRQLQPLGFSFPERTRYAAAVVSADGACCWLQVKDNNRVLGLERYGANDDTPLVESLRSLGYRVVSEHEEEWHEIVARREAEYLRAIDALEEALS